MISRIWHGWTTSENADAYESLLKKEIFLHIESRQIKGYKGIQLLRRPIDRLSNGSINLEKNRSIEVEFITIMRFDSIESIKEFAGEDYEIAVVPPEARKLLSRFDERSQHYEVKKEIIV